MFRRMHLSSHIQDGLRARNSQVVDEAVAKMAEAGAKTGARGGGHPGAARAAVEVEAEGRIPGAEDGERGTEDGVEVGVVLEDGAEAIFDHDGEAKIWPGALEDFERGGGEDAIPEGPKAQHGYARVER
jgi:hypothetical protein